MGIYRISPANIDRLTRRSSRFIYAYILAVTAILVVIDGIQEGIEHMLLLGALMFSLSAFLSFAMVWISRSSLRKVWESTEVQLTAESITSRNARAALTIHRADISQVSPSGRGLYIPGESQDHERLAIEGTGSV